MIPVDWIPPNTQPEVAACVIQAAKEYQLPPLAILGVMVAEGGKIGTAMKNKNGTYDFGPMQINSMWLKTLSPYGVTSWTLTYDLCTNIRAGAWRIKSEIIYAKGDFWRGIGNYHSRTPEHHEPYKQRVISHVTKWMQKANKGDSVETWKRISAEQSIKLVNKGRK